MQIKGTVIVAFIAMSAAATGCVSVSEVTKVGKDTYMVGADVRGGMTSDTEVKMLSLNRANEYCEKMGKVMVADSSTSRGVRGWTPQTSEVTFFCVDENDPANQRLKNRRPPDTIVEIRK
jgi:hypothetical protein